MLLSVIIAMSIPKGYRFRPTDTELIEFLSQFVAGNLILASWFPISETNLYSGEEPWEVFGNSKERVGYFFTPLKKKNPKNSRYQRTIGDGKGTWKAQDKGKPIYRSGKIIGYKRSLRYEKKGSKHDGQWLMKEYYLTDQTRSTLIAPIKDMVLCRIKRKQDMDYKISESQSLIAKDIKEIIGDLNPPLILERTESDVTTLTLATIPESQHAEAY